jgi:hypothetical protein
MLDERASMRHIKDIMAQVFAADQRAQTIGPNVIRVCEEDELAFSPSRSNILSMILQNGKTMWIVNGLVLFFSNGQDPNGRSSCSLRSMHEVLNSIRHFEVFFQTMWPTRFPGVHRVILNKDNLRGVSKPVRDKMVNICYQKSTKSIETVIARNLAKG